MNKPAGITNIRPPLRWAGSKRRVLSRIAPLLPLAYDRYVEPFAGSAALYFLVRPKHALLGDLNSELIAFYETLAWRPGAVSAVAQAFAPNGDDYYAVRSMDPSSLTRIDRAARFLYLNRYCFNGVYRTNRAGMFNVPRGSRTGSLPSEDELLNAGRMLRSAELSATDFEACLEQTESGDFVYIDPPYFTRKGIRPGEYGYGSLGEEDDLARLISALNRLTKRGVRYLLSYSESRTVIRAVEHEWRGYVRVDRSVGGLAAHRKESREVLLANYKIRTESRTF